MRQVGAWIGIVACTLLVGCGESSEPGAGAGGSGGATAGSPTAGGSGGAAGQAAGGSAGSAGSGGNAAPPTCAEQQVACNGACLEVGASMNGCTVLASVDDRIEEMVLDAEHVYVAINGRELSVRRLARGGTSLEVFAPDAPTAHLALSATHVLWTGNMALHAMPKAGGAATAILSDTVDLTALVASGDRAFFARHPFAESHQIVSVDMAGQNRVDNGVAGFTDHPRLAIDGSHVYWTAITGPDPDQLKRSTFNGTEAEVVLTAGGIAGPWLAGGNVYFEESDGYTSSFGNIVSAPSSGGATTLLVERLKLEDDILLGNAQHLFFKDQDLLKSSTLTGQEQQVVLSTAGQIVAAVADDDALYVAVNAEPLGPAYLIQLAP